MTEFQFSNHGDAYDPARQFDATHPTHGLSDHWRDRQDDLTFASRNIDHRHTNELGPIGALLVCVFGALVLGFLALGFFFGTH